MPSTDSSRQYLAELIGTFALVFFGSMSVTVFTIVLGAPNQSAVIGIAFTHGLVVMTMVYAIGHVSGSHINPAVTISMLAAREIGLRDAVGYVVFQLLGAALAGYTHSIVLPQGVASNFGLTLPSPAINNSELTALLVEAILTFFLLFVIFGTAVSAKAQQGFAGIAIGMTITLDILVGGSLTGASMNPARTLGPALASRVFTAHWVYWVGPIIGGLVASQIYKNLFIRK